MKINKKQSRIIVIAIAALACVLVPALLLFNSYNADYNFTKNCYFSNQKTLDNLSQYFKSLNNEGLSHAEFNGNTGEISLYGDSETKITNEELKSTLNGLRAQYQDGFSFVDAYFDSEGDMLLYMQTKVKKTNGDGLNSPDLFICYLVYIDERYSGKNAPLRISDYKDARPVSGNWCYWSESGYSG
ncbi:MAG: hypothetical protein J6C38_08205 [Oscillospiraceae bacterium]|nr:hypothetical protein [Oscillospiraceae bacterium]